MASPTTISIKKNTWTKIATAVNSALLTKYSLDVDFIFATVATVATAPTAGASLFESASTQIIEDKDLIDIYVHSNKSGYITIDTGSAPSLGQILTFSNDGIISSSYAENEIVKGNCYSIQAVLNIASLANNKCVIDLTGVSTGKLIFLLPLSFNASAACLVNTYELTSYTGGTARAFLQNNDLFRATKTAQTVFKHTVTSVVQSATPNLREYNPGAGTNPSSSRAGAATSASQLIKTNDKIICIDITNQTNAAITFGLGIVLYEI